MCKRLLAMKGRLLVFLVMGLCLVSFGQGPYLLVVDASASMGDLMPPEEEETKMDAAKIAAKSFVDKTSGEIGIVTFADCDEGGDLYTGDIRLVQSFTTDKDLLKSRIDDVEPEWGDTAIADALKESKSHLERTKKRGTIILLTDGEETCGGDPTAMAGQIYSEDIGTVHVIGYLIGGEAEIKARQIAGAGGGNYYSANTTIELEQALAEIGKGGILDRLCPGGILVLLPLLGMLVRRS